MAAGTDSDKKHPALSDVKKINSGRDKGFQYHIVGRHCLVGAGETGCVHMSASPCHDHILQIPTKGPRSRPAALIKAKLGDSGLAIPALLCLRV